MKIEAFKLERWLLEKSEIDVGGGGVTKLQLKDLVADMDYDQLLNYGSTNGSEVLRSEVADWYPGIEADNVLITSGTSEANLLSNLHLLAPGDDYLAIYPIYEQTTGFVKSLGCRVIKVFLDKSESWRLDLELLKKRVTENTKIIFFDNPNNPTGACIGEQEMEEICKIAAEVGAYVVCDNAMRGSELDGKPAATPFDFYEKGIITGSLSKLGMTGPRIGWLIGSKDIVQACWKFKDYTTLSHSGIGEYLATIALKKENREKYIRRNLDISKGNLSILENWKKENLDPVEWVGPEAGFTIFPAYHAPIGSEEFCKRFLDEKKVLISPGEYFGVDRHFRLNFGCKAEIMAEVLERLNSFMKQPG